MGLNLFERFLVRIDPGAGMSELTPRAEAALGRLPVTIDLRGGTVRIGG
ncbi:MAG: hypothetical protein JST11_22740 [Acidobacteria bacterium]|nr:hypothetical protein [Acidobacteriota bacterium]